MNKFENKEPENNNESQNVEVTGASLILSVIFSSIMRTANVAKYVFIGMQVIVFSYLTYIIIGKPLFVGLVITPILVGFIYYCLCSYDDINQISGGDDSFFDDEDEDNKFYKL